MKRSLLIVTMMILILPIAMPSWSATYNWKMVSPLPPGKSFNQEIKQFASILEKRAHGKVKITLYEGTLGAPTDAWDMAKSNVIQLCYTLNAVNSIRLPVIGLVDMPFEFPDPLSCKQVLDEWEKAGYLKEVTDNFKILWLMPTSPLHAAFSGKKVSALQDWEKVKVRTPSGAQGQIISALGGSPVSIPSGEVYMALSTGVIDGFVTSAEALVDHKLYEVSKFIIRNPPICYGVLMFMMNKETWASLSPDLQTIIDQVAKEVAETAIDTTQNGLEPIWETISSNADVYNINEAEIKMWRRQTAGIAENYLEKTRASGAPVKQAYEMMKKIVSDYIAKEGVH